MAAAASNKVCSLQELASRVPDGSPLAFGGVFLHRGPFAFARELVQQRRRNLEVIKSSPAYDLDLLCRAKAVARVRAVSSQWRRTSDWRHGHGQPSNTTKRSSKSTPE